MKAIKEAAALATRWNLPLTLLHAVPPVPGLERWKTFLELDRDKCITSSPILILPDTDPRARRLVTSTARDAARV